MKNILTTICVFATLASFPRGSFASAPDFSFIQEGLWSGRLSNCMMPNHEAMKNYGCFGELRISQIKNDSNKYRISFKGECSYSLWDVSRVDKDMRSFVLDTITGKIDSELYASTPSSNTLQVDQRQSMVLNISFDRVNKKLFIDSEGSYRYVGNQASTCNISGIMHANTQSILSSPVGSQVPGVRISHGDNNTKFTWNLDTSISKLGESWSDPSGMIWGDILKNPSGSIRYLDKYEAFSYCNGIGAQLPSGEDFSRLYEYTRTEPIISGPDAYNSQVLPNLQYIYWSSLGDRYKWRNDGIHNDDLIATRCVVPSTPNP